MEDLQGQNWLLLSLFDRNEHKQKNHADGKQRKNEGVRPGEFDTPEFDGQEQGQNCQSKQDGALKVDTLEFALLAGCAAVGCVGDLGVGWRTRQIDDYQQDGEDDWRDLAIEGPGAVLAVFHTSLGTVNLPPPSDNIDEPAAQGTADTSAKGGDQVDIGAPLGHISYRQQV